MGIYARVEQRASIENPSTSLANSDEWLVEALGGGQSKSGVQVNARTALQFSAVWACVNVLSQDVAKLPFPVYRRLSRGKERAREHPVYGLLNGRPNPHMTAYNLRRTLQAHAVTWGKAFAEIERNNANEPIALWPLLPDRTDVHRINGQKVVATRVGSRDVVIPGADVLCLSGLGFDGLRGYSVIGMAREAIGSGLAAEQFGASFFGSGARPGGVVTRPSPMSEEAQDRFRRSWNKVHQGLSGAQRVAVLDEGMDYKMIGIPPEDAQFIATRQFSVIEIARFFRVPPHKIQSLERSTFSNEENEERSYHQDALQAWLVNWEQEVNTTLFDVGATFFAEHVVEGLLRGDSQTRAQFYQSGINNGWLSPNEVRERENLNPVEGGDEYFVPLNLMPLSAPFAPAPQAAPASGQASLRRSEREARSVTIRSRLQKSHVAPFSTIAARIVGKEVDAIRALLPKLDERARADFLADLGKFYERFAPVVEDEYRPLLEEYASQIRKALIEELGVANIPDAQYDAFVRKYLAGMAARHVRKGHDQIKALLSETEPAAMADAVNERLDEWLAKRPGKIAASETVRAMGGLSMAGYMAAGILTLVWRSVGRSCPYCNNLDGMVVSSGQPFMTHGDTIAPDGEEPMVVQSSFRHPPSHGGCDCLVVPGF